MVGREFQSTHPQGVGPLELSIDGGCRAFQSTHPQGVGPGCICPCQPVCSNFNPPTRKGWDWEFLSPICGSAQFQSTHPQGVGLECRPSLAQPPINISIHPPARGGTWAFSVCSLVLLHFNPPTRKGWDHKPCTMSLPMDNFNPPTRKGWDREILCTIAEDEISIHPPARGGTAATPPVDDQT